jgi:hypothetical protein
MKGEIKLTKKRSEDRNNQQERDRQTLKEGNNKRKKVRWKREEKESEIFYCIYYSIKYPRPYLQVLIGKIATCRKERSYNILLEALNDEHHHTYIIIGTV